MQRFLIVMMAAFFTTLSLGAASSMADPGLVGMGGPGFRPDGRLLGALLQLDLTEAQKHEIAVILQRYREEGRQKIQAFRRAVEGLRKATERDPFDEAAVRRAYQPVASAGEEMAVHRARVVSELRGVLTPEQKEALQAERQAMGERFRARVKHRRSFLDEWIEFHAQTDGNG